MILSIVIPTYNGELLLKESIPALLQAVESIKECEIVVIDNNSTDGTESYIRSTVPYAVYKKLDDNYGFTRAVNEGIRLSKGEMILLLNNDCHINAQGLQEMIAFLHTHSTYVATQPVVLRLDGSVENIGFTVDLSIAKADAVTTYSGHDNNDIFIKKHCYGLSASCLLMRRSVLDSIGYFDESFHSYLEDVDFSIRMAKQQLSFAPCLTAQVIHKHMATSSTMGAYKEKHDFFNWIRIIIKNYPLSFSLRYIIPLSIERLKNLNGWRKKAGTI